MIRIDRINKRFSEEYINEAFIKRCWKDKKVDKKKTFKATMLPLTENTMSIPFRCEKVETRLYYDTYRDRDNGTLYTYAKTEFYDYNLLNEQKDENFLYPGWNQIEIIPEEFHYTYWVEIEKSNSEIYRNIDSGFGGWHKDEVKKTEIIEITEDTYNRIIKN